MGVVVRFAAPRVAELVEEPELELQADEVRIAMLYSGISAGTELSVYRGTNPYLDKRWDPDRRMFVEGARSIAYPLDGWGYEEVGKIVEVGPEATGVAVDDIVWGRWGHRATVTRPAAYARERILDPAADTVVGVFSEIGAIALNVVLDADIHVGETVAVFGLGVLGQLVAQLARLNGATVIGVDTIDYRLQLAAALGAVETVDARTSSAAERVRELTGGRGADVALEVSGHYQALHEAVRATAYSARVVAAGFLQGPASELRLGEEFHHNRIQLVCSQISGVAPALRYRWDIDRLRQTAIALALTRTLEVLPLISHMLPVTDAAAAFDLLDRRPHEALQVVLQFDGMHR
jgi:threonine dehydrogenase-like Zn-dependent dehydrogenase